MTTPCTEVPGAALVGSGTGGAAAAGGGGEVPTEAGSGTRGGGAALAAAGSGTRGGGVALAAAAAGAGAGAAGAGALTGGGALPSVDIIFLAASLAAISSCMLMGAGLPLPLPAPVPAPGAAAPAPAPEVEVSLLPGTTGALLSLINDLSTLFSFLPLRIAANKGLSAPSSESAINV